MAIRELVREISLLVIPGIRIPDISDTRRIDESKVGDAIGRTYMATPELGIYETGPERGSVLSIVGKPRSRARGKLISPYQ